MATGQRIEAITAYLAVDPEDGTEGVVAQLDPDRGWLPMVGADAERIASLRPVAEQMARTTGIPIRLVRFTAREDLVEIRPWWPSAAGRPPRTGREIR